MAHRYIVSRIQETLLTGIGGVASFQAIMHVLSELRTPLFDNSDRQRALRALQMSRMLRENNTTKAWQAVRSMIDKAIAEHTSSQRPQSQTSSTFNSPSLPVSASIPGGTNSTRNVQVYPIMGEMPNYAIQVPHEPYMQPTRPQHMQPQPQPQSDILQPMQSIQEPIGPCWEDINLSNINNIVGDVQLAPSVVPEFDFVGASNVINVALMLIITGLLG
jgi:hypothetical protein